MYLLFLTSKQLIKNIESYGNILVDLVSQNNNPTAGKIIGASIGAATAGYFGYRLHNNIKNLDEFLNSEKLKLAIESSNLGNINKTIMESKIKNQTKNKYLQFFKKINSNNKLMPKIIMPKVENLQIKLSKIKKVSIPISLFLGSSTVLFGLAIGAIVDHFRKDD